MRLHLIRDVVRAKEIVAILLRYRFDQLLENSDTPASWFTRIVPAKQADQPLFKRIRLAIEELGPTFIKIGQVLSTRPDLLPAELIDELACLRDQVTPIPFEEMRPILESEFGNTLDSVFSEFNPSPTATGSLGQIYKAHLKQDDLTVAVKIQKPGLRQRIVTDIEVISWIIAQAHLNLPSLQAYDLPSVIAELKSGLLGELDFSNEARHADTFNSLNQFPEEVFAPHVIKDYTTPRLLVTEWIDGQRPTDLNAENQDRPRLAKLGGRSFFSQIVETGFFHGDPHPGNILITADGRLCLLDWGLVGMLTRTMRHALVDLFSACAKRDPAEVTRIAIRLGHSTHRLQRMQLEKAITTILFKYDSDLRTMQNIGSVIVELVYIFGSNGIQVARDYTLLAKAILSIEQTARLIDPHFNLARIGQPYIRQLQQQRWDPRTVATETMAEWRQQLHHAGEIPADLQRILHRLEEGQVALKIDHMEANRATNTIHHAFSRLSLAVIIGSLLIGSSFVINSGIKPFLWGYPAIGIIGYLLSAAIGSYVAFDILRSGHLKR